MLKKHLFATMIKKLIRIQLLILCFSFIAFSSFSQKSHDAKLIGGMYLNAGYLKSIDDIALGIGGKMAFKVCDNFRIGCEGYGSSATYKKDGSFYSIGWGGVLGEFILPYKKSLFIVGITIGGGSNRQMEIVVDNNSSDAFDYVKWDKKGSFITSPFIAYEYKISSKANLSAKLDYVTSPSGDIFYKGIRLYVGCLFNMIN